MRRFLIALLLALPLFAHEGLHEQIEAVTHAIAKDPRNAALYLKRGELHRLHGQWKDAQRDYERARALDPDLYGVELAQGRMLFDSGRATVAVAVLQRYVQLAPQDAEGQLALARALMKAGQASAAIAPFERALSRRHDPEVVLEYVAALIADKRRDDALRYLDNLAPLVTYQLAAIDLELRAGRFEAALRRVEAAEAVAARKEEWMERRGDILAKLGRTDEARTAYQAALDALSSLPPARRRTRAMLALEQRLRSELRLDQREQQPRAEQPQ
jgi:Flp pilus assembly protein TadD